MTKEIREAMLKVSELREKINLESAKDEPNSETLESLRKQSLQAEKELREALAAAEDDENQGGQTLDREARERLELRSKSKLADYIRAAITGQPVKGASAEYAAAEGCEGHVPLALFEEGREKRTVTPAPADSNLQQTQHSIVPAIFDRSIASWLGVEMPSVGVGIQAYPVLSTSLTGGMKGEDAAAAETAGAFSVTSADPRRLTGSFRIRKEDVAKLEGLESALRENLSMVLSDALDGQLVDGNGTAPNLNGILNQLTDPTAPAASAETFARYVAALASHVDGLWATSLSEIRALVGPHTYRHAAGVFRSDSDSMTAEAWAQSRTGGLRVSRRIADPASNIQQAVIRRGNPAGDRVAVAPVWTGLELIRDPYTDAKKGQIIITGVSLVGGVVLLRKDAFVQDSFRLAA